MSTPIRSPREKTVRQLFAASMNRCAFPDCNATIFNIEANVLVGEICHIHAAKAGGPRFDSRQSDKERHGYDNLVLMCSTHHKIIDAPERVSEFTADHLRTIKRRHEKSASVGLAKDQALLELAVLAIKRLQGLDATVPRLEASEFQGTATGVNGDSFSIESEAGFLDKLNDAELGLESIGNISHAANAISEELSRIVQRASAKTRAISANSFSTATKLVVANQMAMQFQSPADRLEILAKEYASAVSSVEPGIIYLFDRMAADEADCIAGQEFLQVFEVLAKAAETLSFKQKLNRAMIVPLVNITRSFKKPVDSLTTSFSVFERANQRVSGWQPHIQRLLRPVA